MIEQREVENDYNKNCLSQNIRAQRMKIQNDMEVLHENSGVIKYFKTDFKEHLLHRYAADKEKTISYWNLELIWFI